ncbi:hypothetical protein QJQ45_005589 [Haematococcus lacustris]|nr:hypothetical protein QJQ45_005589 [Haematococcus lacustris]
MFAELVGMIELKQSIPQPAAASSKAVYTANLVTKLQGGDVAAVKLAQLDVEQLSSPLQPAGSPATPSPAHTPRNLQCCARLQSMGPHGTVNCRMHAATCPVLFHAAVVNSSTSRVPPGLPNMGCRNPPAMVATSPRPTKLIQQGTTCRPLGNLTQLLQTCCSILGRTLDDYQPHTGGTRSWGKPP